MKSNVEIIQEVIEEIVNQKQIDKWDEYFSPEYISRGAPFIGMGYSIDSSGNKNTIRSIAPGSPVDEKLQVGDELLWVENELGRWATYEEIKQGFLQGYRGNKYKAGVRRSDQNFEYELTRDLFMGFDTQNDHAKSEMREFMEKEFPALMATIKLILSDGDMVVSLLEYRGTHVNLEREAVWREAWFVRMSEGKIVEGWPVIDLSSYFRQLGYQIIPPCT